MLKKIIRDTGFAFLSVIVMNMIFIFVATYCDMLRPFSGVITVGVFLGILYLGCLIGGKFFSINHASIISVIVLPLLMLGLLYIVGLCGISFIEKVLGFPSAIWGEALNYRTYNNFIIFMCLFFHYLLLALSLFVGAYRKGRIKEHK